MTLGCPLPQGPAGQRLRVWLPCQVADDVAEEHQRHGVRCRVCRTGGNEGQAPQWHGQPARRVHLNGWETLEPAGININHLTPLWHSKQYTVYRKDKGVDCWVYRFKVANFLWICFFVYIWIQESSCLCHRFCPPSVCDVWISVCWHIQL